MTHVNRPVNRFDRLWVKLVFAGVILALGSAVTLVVRSRIIKPSDVTKKVDRQDIVYFSGENSNDPELGYRVKPYTWSRQFYPDNPRGYFHEESPADRQLIDWRVSGTESVDVQVIPSANTFPLHVTVHAKKEGVPVWDAAIRNAPIDVPAGSDGKFIVRGSSEVPRTIYAVFWPKGDWGHRLATIELPLETSSKEFVVDFPKSKENAQVIVGLDLGGASGSFQIEQMSIENIHLVSDDSEIKYSIDNVFNKWGYRDVDWELKPKEGVIRIACIGDSFTFAQGVKYGDRFTDALAKTLNERPTSNQKFEVLNFGLCGYSTNEEWELFRKEVLRFDPQIVVLTMCWNDSIWFKDDVALGKSLKGDPEKFKEEYALIIQNEKYKNCIKTIDKIHSLCRSNGCQLFVGIFNVTDSAEWALLVSEVLPAMNKRKIPVFDVREELIAAKCFGLDGAVHKVDLHPNEKAHAVYGKKLASVIQSNMSKDPP